MYVGISYRVKQKTEIRFLSVTMRQEGRKEGSRWEKFHVLISREAEDKL